MSGKVVTSHAFYQCNLDFCQQCQHRPMEQQTGILLGSSSYHKPVPSIFKAKLTAFNLPDLFRKKVPAMTQKAFGKGSKFPPIVNPGQIRLYGMRFCPYVKRVRLVLADNKIQNEVININLSEKPEWYLQRFPEGKVPAVELNGKFLFESLIIADFLDDLSPGHKLNPTDPLQKALDKCLLSKFSGVSDNWGKAVHNPNVVKECIATMWPTLMLFEEELTKRGTSFYGGNKPKMIDLMIWPWFEMMLCAQDFLGPAYSCDYILPNDRFQNLKNWMKTMMMYPAVKQLLNIDQLAAFAKSIKANSLDYDAGLDKEEC